MAVAAAARFSADGPLSATAEELDFAMSLEGKHFGMIVFFGLYVN